MYPNIDYETRGTFRYSDAIENCGVATYHYWFK
jgi:hypothetical protein